MRHQQVSLYAPKIFGLEFFDSEYGHLGAQGAEQWHYNQEHELVIAANDRQLISYSWVEVPPRIQCYSKDAGDVGRTFEYQVRANITDCEEKHAKGDVISRDLIVCGYTHHLSIKVISLLFQNPSSLGTPPHPYP